LATRTNPITVFPPMTTNEVTINVVARVPGTNVVTLNILSPTPDTNSVVTNAVAAASANTSSSHDFSYFWHHTHHAMHIAVIVILAFGVHMLVKLISNIGETLIAKSNEKRNPLGFVTHQPKFVTLTTLIVSTLTFIVYALALYLILAVEFPNNSMLKTYLGSAAVVGLALSFGLQGLVQDVVTGVTIILSDTMDVGDTVDLMNGVIGRVERVGLRFTKVVNFYNQQIFVPNRNIINVSRFPRGGLLAFADVQIPAKADQAAVSQTVQNVAKGVASQFAAIILAEPAFSKIHATPGNWNYMRIEFKIWPGQNAIIETTFRSQMVNAMKTYDSAYAAWQVVVTYRAIET
jgi:small-conductance mechanosensitive channel